MRTKAEIHLKNGTTVSVYLNHLLKIRNTDVINATLRHVSLRPWSYLKVYVFTNIRLKTSYIINNFSSVRLNNWETCLVSGAAWPPLANMLLWPGPLNFNKVSFGCNFLSCFSHYFKYVFAFIFEICLSILVDLCIEQM